MVPGVWGPYFGAMLPGWWLNEGGQSAAGSLIDWTLRRVGRLADAGARSAAQPTQTSMPWPTNGWPTLEAREAEPARHLHVLPDHHGNRSPRADPEARGASSLG